MRGTTRAQHPRGRKEYSKKKEIATMLGKVTEQVFAKMAAVKKRKVRSDPVDNQMLAAFGNTSISDKSEDDVGSLSSHSTVKTGSSASTSSSSSSGENSQL